MDKTTMTALNDQIMESINNINNLEIGTTEHFNAVKETCELLDRYNEAEKNQMEYWDKEDRRELERERNETMAQIEREKNELSKPRMILEIAKIAVPIAIQISSYVAYNHFQKRVLEFEENGRITSTAGRDLKLPRFFK